MHRILINLERKNTVNVVETQGLTKYYSGGKVKVLEDVSLQVEKGKIFSLLGPNGAGKTTLIKLLLGIVFPTRGSAKLLGKDISDHTAHPTLEMNVMYISRFGKRAFNEI